MGHRKTSTITQKLSSFFKEAVKAPPPEPEPTPEEPELPPLTTHTDEWEETPEETTADEEEVSREQTEAPDVLDELNSATQRWKETGDPGLHLEAPVPLSERAKQVWNKIAHDVSPKVAHALKNKIDIVAQTANTKIHELREAQHARALQQQEARRAATPAQTPPTPPAPELRVTRPTTPGPQAAPLQKTSTRTQETTVPATTPEQIDNAIIASWMEVLAKAEEKATPSEREEIEKLYKQLSQ